MNISKLVLFSTLCWGILLVWYINNNIVPSVVSMEWNIRDADNENINKINTSNNSIKPAIINTNSSDKTVWINLSRQLQLDHHTDKTEVKKEVRKILQEQNKFYQILQAAGPYIYFILEQTKNKGLPAEIALIPIIESEFNPHDYSNKGATGLWQFMRGTAKDLGIIITSGYDGRKNVAASTKAAMAYLNDLGKMFKGNWYLAFAAYNSGEGKVKSAMRRAGSQTFWNLPLPKETQLYIPRLLAVAAIVKNPEKYGVKLPPIQNKPYFEELKTKKSVDLTKLASATGVPLDALKALNPDYKNGNVQPKNGAYSILVPLDHLEDSKKYLSDNIISQ